MRYIRTVFFNNCQFLQCFHASGKTLLTDMYVFCAYVQAYVYVLYPYIQTQWWIDFPVTLPVNQWLYPCIHIHICIHAQRYKRKTHTFVVIDVERKKRMKHTEANICLVCKRRQSAHCHLLTCRIVMMMLMAMVCLRVHVCYYPCYFINLWTTETEVTKRKKAKDFTNFSLFFLSFLSMCLYSKKKLKYHWKRCKCIYLLKKVFFLNFKKDDQNRCSFFTKSLLVSIINGLWVCWEFPEISFSLSLSVPSTFPFYSFVSASFVYSEF